MNRDDVQNPKCPFQYVYKGSCTISGDHLRKNKIKRKTGKRALRSCFQSRRNEIAPRNSIARCSHYLQVCVRRKQPWRFSLQQNEDFRCLWSQTRIQFLWNAFVVAYAIRALFNSVRNIRQKRKRKHVERWFNLGSILSMPRRATPQLLFSRQIHREFTRVIRSISQVSLQLD